MSWPIISAALLVASTCLFLAGAVINLLVITGVLR